MSDEKEKGTDHPAGENPIKLELESSTGSRHDLSRPLDLSVRITNVSDEPIWMVGVLPGSEGLRYPQYQVEIQGPSGPVRMRFPEGLDYARGLRPEDFVRLAPGESFDPQQGKGFVPIQKLAWFQPSEKGTYRMRLRLDATAEDVREWLGHTPVRDQRKVESLLRQVPHVSAESNTLEIVFD
jgi:hypothetical protein